MPKTIFDLKNKAHELIEDLVDSGVPKNRVYKKLASLLRVSREDAHLSNMISVSQVRRAIQRLQLIRKWYSKKRFDPYINQKDDNLYNFEHRMKLFMRKNAKT